MVYVATPPEAGLVAGGASGVAFGGGSSKGASVPAHPAGATVGND